MRAIVTGGCGFIGSNLVDRLIELGHEVVVLDNLITGSINNLNPKAEFFNVDVNSEFTSYNADDPELGEDDLYALSNITADVIFHLAALARIQPSFHRPKMTILNNCMGTVNMLELASSRNMKMVYAGSSSFYSGPHINPYAHSKWIGEEHCKMYNEVYGVSVAIARFFNVYGPRHVKDGDNAAVLGIFERQIANNEPITVTGTGEQKRDFTAVEDIVDGLIAMSEKSWNGEIFNLGRGENYSINEIAAMFKPKEIVHIPARPGEAQTTLADLTFTKNNINWTPHRNVSDYISNFVKGIA